MSEIMLDRGMTIEEVQTLLTAPMPDRERAFFRTIYETFFRVNELLMYNIEDYNKKTGWGEVHQQIRKYHPAFK